MNYWYISISQNMQQLALIARIEKYFVAIENWILFSVFSFEKWAGIAGCTAMPVHFAKENNCLLSIMPYCKSKICPESTDIAIALNVARN